MGTNHFAKRVSTPRTRTSSTSTTGRRGLRLPTQIPTPLPEQTQQTSGEFIPTNDHQSHPGVLEVATEGRDGSRGGNGNVDVNSTGQNQYGIHEVPPRRSVRERKKPPRLADYVSK